MNARLPERRILEIIGGALDRRAEAQPVEFVEVFPAEWKPLPQECHANAHRFASETPGATTVRGVLFETVPGNGLIVMPHTVVRLPDGELADITPNDHADRPPFLQLALEEVEFVGFEMIMKALVVKHSPLHLYVMTPAGYREIKA